MDILQHSAQDVERLWENTRFFQAELRTLGFDLGRTQTPITPVMVGEAQPARAFSAALFQAGVLAQAIVFPTVPRGTARLRLMVSAVHTRQDLTLALHTLAQVGRV